MARVYHDTNERVAHLGKVTRAVHKATESGAAKARANLAAHRQEGHAQIEVELKKTDGIVTLVDTAALSIEFGGYNHWAGRVLPGLYIVTGAFDIVKGGWGGRQ